MHDMVVENNLLAEYADTSGQMKDLNWSTSKILSNEWTVDDLTILRAYEWERINFSTPGKRVRVATMMGISVEELDQLRKNTFASAIDNVMINKSKNVVQEHHGDHRSTGAESYPGIKIDRGEPVGFGF